MGKFPKYLSGRSPVAMPASKFGAVATAYPPPIEPEGHGNVRVLLVGPPDRLPLEKFFKYLTRFSMLDGFPTEFTSISAAMDAIPLMDPNDPSNFIDRWTILVTPGWYVEEVRMKPFVNIIGLAADSVYISPPLKHSILTRVDGSTARSPVLTRVDGSTPARATVYMNHFTTIRNVNIAKRAYSLETDYAIWNKDTYGVKREGTNKKDVSDFSAFDVNLFPFPNEEEWGWETAHPRQENREHVMSKSILMEGEFSTAFMVNVGSSYNWRREFDVEIKGTSRQNLDCHFVNCFFDSLFLDRGDEGGCMKVSGCFEVHVRNSLLRVGALPPRNLFTDVQEAVGRVIGGGGGRENFFKGAALRVMEDAKVCVEGSSLMGMESDRVLDVERPLSSYPDNDDEHDNKVISGCLFAHSSTDSVRGREWVDVMQGLPEPR
jgi:hypothetical protein